MASSGKEGNSKNTLQQVLEQERAKIPSKFEFNKVLFEWESNDRPTLTVSGKQKSVLTSLLVLFGLYFWWIGQPILTLLAAAVFFIIFVFISLPPQRMKHAIEKIGMRSGDVSYMWDDMKSFWMTEKDGVVMLYVDMRLNFPARLVMIVETYDEAKRIADILIKRLEYRFLRGVQTRMDKLLEGTYIDPVIFFGDMIEQDKLREQRDSGR